MAKPPYVQLAELLREHWYHPSSRRCACGVVVASEYHPEHIAAALIDAGMRFPEMGAPVKDPDPGLAYAPDGTVVGRLAGWIDGTPVIDAAPEALDFPPDIRLGMNQNDLGMYEVWAKRDRQALAYRSGHTLNEALTSLFAAVRGEATHD